MAYLRLFAFACLLLCAIAPASASETQPEIRSEQEQNADNKAVAPEKTGQEPVPEIITEIKPEIILGEKTDALQQLKSEITGPDITPYKLNPLAVKAVDRSLSMFTQTLRERFELWLSRSGKYRELMVEILKSKDVPEDIFFLALIESGFNPLAYSRSRAVGPWQFISATARRYGLVIDWWRDERRDPVKSTIAAADYLNDLYDIFGSWNLAMAAYNAGEGKILRALHRTKSDDYWSLLKTRHIKKETKNYVPKFIAASMIAVNPEEYGFKDLEYHSPFEYDEVAVEGPLDLEVAANCANTTLEVIKDLNPELRRWCTPPGMPVYILRIPLGTKEAFLDNLSKIPSEERFTVEVYTVKKGDTIEKLAKKLGVTVKVILALNAMEKSATLKPGTEIYLPPKGKFQADRDDRYDNRKSRKTKKSNSANNGTTKKLAAN